jgi:hypothetical protein
LRRPELETNLAIEVYGRRIYKDQTLYEYFLEFMLVFLAEKVVNGVVHPGGCFLDWPKPVSYRVPSRVALKRLLFFPRSKRDHKYPVDEEAYTEYFRLLKSHVDSSNELLSNELTVRLIQELFCGFTAVQRNRSWFAQSLLPICREVVFPEAMAKRIRRKLRFDWEDPDVDEEFEFHGYYFMARGGEVYFSHLMQGFQNRPELRSVVTNGLTKLVDSFPMFSLLARWAESLWNTTAKYSTEPIAKTCGEIPDGYKRRATLTCEELANLLQSEIDPLRKMEVLAQGIVLQILRMMHEQARTIVYPGKENPTWIVHVPGCSNLSVRQSSMHSYSACEDDLITVLYEYQESWERSRGKDPETKQDEIRDASDNSHKLFRKLGKEIRLVVPPKGTGMRFSLSEDLVRFLVLALVPPGEKVLLSTFLDRLFEHFGMVISPKHEPKCPWLNTNEEAFRTMLKDCGFLRDLSDATSIVENPFKELAVQDESIG